MLSHVYNIIIGHGVRDLGRDQEVVNVLNDTYKSFISMLMKYVQLPISSGRDTQMETNTATQKLCISLSK